MRAAREVMHGYCLKNPGWQGRNHFMRHEIIEIMLVLPSLQTTTGIRPRQKLPRWTPPPLQNMRQTPR